MKNLRTLNYGVLFAVGLAFSACGSPHPDRDGARPDPEVLGGKADMPGWVSLRSDKLACGGAVQGAMKGYDSAHAFALQAQAGMVYSIDFGARYAPDRGSVAAVYDPSGALVRRDRNPYGQDASLSFTAKHDGLYYVAVYSVRWSATGEYQLRTSCGLEGLNQLSAGQQAFSTFERQYRFPLGATTLESAAGGDARSAAPQGRSGEVEEGDIYKVDGNTLYYFNTYRGLMIFDISNSTQPKLISRVPLYGYPIEMFVENGKVYALIRDALYLKRSSDSLRFTKRNVSQLVSVDVVNPSQPKILQAIDIKGQLREGVSRKIDNTVYVVSSQPRWYFWGWETENQQQPSEQAWVYSFNIGDPNNIKLIQKLQIFEGGGYSEHDEGGSSSRYFSSVAISATSNVLMVVENWSKYGYVYNGPSCGSSHSLQQAVVSLIDISDPQGAIKLHSKFETYGQLGDQFKQTYTVDPTSGKATYLGIFARREWSSQDCSGSSMIENNLEAWDVTNGASPVLLDRLAFGKPNETVRGSTFDPVRQVAFAITARNVDPLYAISFADPANLKVLSEIDGLSGDMNVFRFIADRKFIIGIGRDNSGACTGFDQPAANRWSTNVAVSIVDVQNLADIKLVQRQCVAIENADWVSSSVNWNLDQAHKMIGMHSDGLVNVVTVPVSYTKKNDSGSWWYYEHETAVGVLSWDLTQYNPALDHTQQNVLVNHGSVVHPKGEVRRSIVFTQQGKVSRRKMINLSDTHLSLTDIEDLDNPIAESVVEVAPYVADMHRFGGYMVEQVKSEPWAWGEGDYSEFRVRSAAGSYQDNAVVASFRVSQVERAIEAGDKLVLIRRVKASAGGDPWSGTWNKQAVVYDLSNPASPVLAGTAELPMQYIAYYRYWCGTSPFWFNYADANGWTGVKDGIVFLSSQYDWQNNTTDRKLVLLDLSNGFAPTVVEQALPSDAALTFVGIASDPRDATAVLVTSKERIGSKDFAGQQFDEVKYFVQRWTATASGFAAGVKVNVPGQLVKAAYLDGRDVLITSDQSWEKLEDGSLRSHPRISVLRLPAFSATPTAQLVDARRFVGMYVKDMVLDEDKLFVNARENVYYGGPIMSLARASSTGGTEQSKPTGDELRVYRVSADYGFTRIFGEDTGATNLELMGIKNRRLFVSLVGDGVLVINFANATKPVGVDFVRTLGYASHVAFDADSAFVASGYYGVYRVETAAQSQIPSI